MNPIQRIPTIELLDSWLAAETAVIYFGDSSLTNVSPLDENKDPIHIMLQDSVAQSVGGVPHSAYHLGLYAEFAHYIAAQETQPDVVIVPINLRSFSPIWDIGPSFQFDKETLYLRENNPLWLKAFYTPLSIFRWYTPSVSHQEYVDTAVYDGTEQVGTVREFNDILTSGVTAESREASLIYSYMAQIPPDHRKLKAMIELVDTYQSHNIDVILYITPIDYQFGESLLGERFTVQVENNTVVISQLLADKDVQLLDLTFALESEFFNWDKYPNEHLTEHGRSFIADQLAHELNQLGVE
ncbi:MAG: hypothetical protein AAF490_17915 [Chloroflexota bacterium]